MSPEQSMLNTLIKKLHDLNIRAFDTRPVDYSKYPFVDVNDIQLIPVVTKSRIYSTVLLQLNVWAIDRIDCTTLAAKILKIGHNIRQSDQYNVSPVDQSFGIAYRTDNSTSITLLRAIVSLEFRLN